MHRISCFIRSWGIYHQLFTGLEQIIVETLDDFLPSAAQSYRQGVQDLYSGVPRFSYRGTACELREALQETLDYLAPDEDITNSHGSSWSPIVKAQQ